MSKVPAPTHWHNSIQTTLLPGQHFLSTLPLSQDTAAVFLEELTVQLFLCDSVVQKEQLHSAKLCFGHK